MSVLDRAPAGLARAHNSVTTVLAGDNQTVIVHFHCPCGTNRRDIVLDTHHHPASRYAAAIRRLHARGAWPTPDIDLGDAADAGWGNPRPESE